MYLYWFKIRACHLFSALLSTSVGFSDLIWFLIFFFKSRHFMEFFPIPFILCERKFGKKCGKYLESGLCQNRVQPNTCNFEWGPVFCCLCRKQTWEGKRDYEFAPFEPKQGRTTNIYCCCFKILWSEFSGSYILFFQHWKYEIIKSF